MNIDVSSYLMEDDEIKGALKGKILEAIQGTTIDSAFIREVLNREMRTIIENILDEDEIYDLIFNQIKNKVEEFIKYDDKSPFKMNKEKL